MIKNLYGKNASPKKLAKNDKAKNKLGSKKSGGKHNEHYDSDLNNSLELD
jgi:hypothetical protein